MPKSTFTPFNLKMAARLGSLSEFQRMALALCRTSNSATHQCAPNRRLLVGKEQLRVIFQNSQNCALHCANSKPYK